MEKSEFIDNFIDRLYMCGEKDDGKYILTLKEATQAAEEMYTHYKELIDIIENMYINHKINSLNNYLNKHEDVIRKLIKNNKH